MCQSPQIASVEAQTQAIQQYQTLADLKSRLQTNNEPPVPIISGKQAVLRVYFNPVQAVTQLTIPLSGVSTQSKPAQLQPGCAISDQRAELPNGCRSVDFYFTPPSGAWTATLDVRDSSGAEIEGSSPASQAEIQGPSDCGRYLSVMQRTILETGFAPMFLTDTGAISLLTKLAPTNAVTIEPTGDMVTNDVGSYWSWLTQTHDWQAWWKDTLNDLVSSRSLTMRRTVSTSTLLFSESCDQFIWVALGD